MFWFKLKAGALQLTLFIIVVIALFLMAFILLVHTHKQFQIQSSFAVETTKNSNFGINHALHESTTLNDTIKINVDDNDYKSLYVYRDYWGAFERVTSISKVKNFQFKKIALLGNKQANENRMALYIQDNNRPLVLVGNTKISGVAYLPEREVKSGTISGQSYHGSQLIYGEQKQSHKLPSLNGEMLTNLKKLLSLKFEYNYEQQANIEEGMQYSNSFSEKLKTVYSNSVLNLIDVHLTGHILVQSKSKIVVHSSSRLKDVVLVAPEIEIQDNVIGNFQAIASKKISVGNNATLNYPSVLVLIQEQETNQSDLIINPNQENNSIVVGDNSTIKGLIMHQGKEKLNNYKSQVIIKKHATLYGELYCNLNTELNGKVYGTVYVNNFLTKQSGSIYQNHLYNTTIDVNELPKEYVGISLINPNTKDVLKWLY